MSRIPPLTFATLVAAAVLADERDDPLPAGGTIASAPPDRLPEGAYHLTGLAMSFLGSEGHRAGVVLAELDVMEGGDWQIRVAAAADHGLGHRTLATYAGSASMPLPVGWSALFAATEDAS